MIGRLAINYIRGGMTTLAEVTQQVLADIPELSATDVNAALNAKNPNVQRRVRSAIQKRVAQMKSQALVLTRLDQATEDALPEPGPGPAESAELVQLRKRLSDLRQLRLVTAKIELARQGVFAPRKKRTTAPAIAALQKVLRDLRREAFRADIDAGRLDRAVRTLDRLQTQLKTGLREVKAGRPIDPAALAAIKQDIQAVRHEMRVTDQLTDLQGQLRTGQYKVPPKRIQKPVSLELERKQIQIARLRKEIANRIEEAAPWTKGKVGREVLDTLRTLKATGDVSFTFRQNVVLAFSHPLIAARNFGRSLKALFSENSMERINNSLRNSKYALYYDVSKLALLDIDSHLPSQGEEFFRAKVIQNMKWPVFRQASAIIRASNRHATTFSNLMRASLFDQFMDSFPNATMEEMRVYANFLNVVTGLGDMGKLGNATNLLSIAIFAPRLTVSRFQTPYKVAKIMYTQPRVRKAVARDMVGFVATGASVLGLAALAGASVNWDDPRDPDFLKIRIGDRRYDIFGGFLQPARLILRLGLLFTDAPGLTGKELTTREKVGDPAELIGQFTVYKLAPIWSMARELTPRGGLKWQTAVGEPTNPPLTLARALVPMWMEDVYDGWKRYGVAGAASVAPAVIPGVGVQTYEDSQMRTRQKIRRALKAGDLERGEQIRGDYNLRHPEKPIGHVSLQVK